MKRIMMMTAALASSGLSLGCGDDTSCGAGTTKQDGVCVAEDELACGEGTQLVDGACVLTQSPAGTAPDLVALATNDPFPGGGFIELQGTGFNAADGGELAVTVGGVAVEVFYVTDTAVVAQLPQAITPTVTVEVSNAHGADALPFEYLGFYVADGRGNFGSLHFTDPRNGFSVEVGRLERDAGGEEGTIGYSISGLAFGPDGTLYGSAVGNQALLVTIDRLTGAVTEVGTLTSQEGKGGTTDHYYVPDIAWLGNELYGWTEDGDNLIRIDPATGAVTVLNSDLGSAGSGLVAYDATQFIGVMNNDDGFASLIQTTGAYADHVELNGDSGSSVCALDKTADGVYYGLLADGSNGLLRFDFATGDVAVLGASTPSSADALAIPSDFASKASAYANTSLEILPAWEATLPASAKRAVPRPVVEVNKLKASAVFGVAKAKRGTSMGLTAYLDRQGLTFARGLTVKSARDADLAISREAIARGAYELRANQRGNLKLVDVASGKTLARDVVEFTAP